MRHTELAKCEVRTRDASRKVERVERPSVRKRPLVKGNNRARLLLEIRVIMAPRSERSLSVRLRLGANASGTLEHRTIISEQVHHPHVFPQFRCVDVSIVPLQLANDSLRQLMF